MIIWQQIRFIYSLNNLLFYQMDQESQKLIPQTDLASIFPDIQGQLCSRHSTLFGKLKVTFNKLYDRFDPSHYVVVKATTNVIQSDQVSLSMALQNGMILLVKKTYLKQKIFFNGNHIDEEIIFDPDGKLNEGLHEWNEEMEIVFKEVIEDLSLGQLNGGIMYLHSNIPEKFFHYKKIMLMGLFLGLMIINDQIKEYSVPDLIRKMAKTQVMGDYEFIEQQFMKYENRKFNLKVGENNFRLPLEDELKMVFCRLDLASEDIEYQKKRKRELNEAKNKTISCLSEKCGVTSFYQAFEEQVVLPENLLPEGQKDQYKQFINQEMKELSMICEFSNKNLTFKEVIENQWNFNANIWKVYAEEVVELVEEIKENSKIETCLIVENQFLLIPVQKNNFTQLICRLRQLCHRGELKSKSLFKIEEQIVENRWGSDKQIGEKIFASVPSKGVGIFDPSQSMWFD